MSDKPQDQKETTACSGRKYGAIGCICVCALIAFIAWLYAPKPEPARRLWLPVVVGTNGATSILGDSRQLEFWTPSTKTKDYLHKEGSAVAAGEKWEVLENDDPVLQFGNMLHTNQSVLGYRRVEIWGQGRTSFKPGWWWTVNVLTNYSAADLGRAYQSFWKSQQMVFVEVIDNRGHAGE
jgi:hypothetical protein